MKPTPQTVQKQIYQARDDILDETGKFASTARSQLTGVETIPMARQATPTLPVVEGNAEDYRQKVEDETKQRMTELKAIIEEELAKARAKREEQERLWQQAQREGLTEEKKVEGKQGNLLSRAAKRIKGRLGQIGKGKMEKGKAAGA